MKVALNQTRKFHVSKKLINKIFLVIGRALPRYAGHEVSLALVDNQAIRKLNKTYRRIDRPTDVLSFPENGPVGYPPAGKFLGEIIISVPYARKQARSLGHSLKEELAVLFIHGFLHLVGFDHLNKKDGQKMKRSERTIFNKFSKLRY